MLDSDENKLEERPTIREDFRGCHEFMLNKWVRIILRIYDYPGNHPPQEFMHYIHMFILMYDIFNLESYEKIDTKWKDIISIASDFEHPEDPPILLLGNKLDLDFDLKNGKRIKLTQMEIKLLVFGFCRSTISNQYSEYNDLINLCVNYCSFKIGVPRCEAKKYAELNGMVFHEVSAIKSIGIHGAIRDIVLKKFSKRAGIYSLENTNYHHNDNSDKNQNSDDNQASDCIVC